MDDENDEHEPMNDENHEQGIAERESQGRNGFGRKPRKPLQRKAWPNSRRPMSAGSVGGPPGSESEDDVGSGLEATPAADGPGPKPGTQAWLDAKRGYRAEFEADSSSVGVSGRSAEGSVRDGSAPGGSAPEDSGPKPGTQAWLDAQRGYRPELEEASVPEQDAAGAAGLKPGTQAWLDAQRGYRPELEVGPESMRPANSAVSSGHGPKPGTQAWLDAQRGYRPEFEPGPGSEPDPGLFPEEAASAPAPKPGTQAWLDAQRGYRPESEARYKSQRRSRQEFSRRSRPEPRWARNDPERPIGYDPERWAGLETEDHGDDGPSEPPPWARPEPRWARNDPERPVGYDPERWAGLDSEEQGDGGREPSDAPTLFDDPAGPADPGAGTGGRKRSGAKRPFGQDSGKRSGLSSGRRSDRPKKPRPHPTAEERAQRAEARRERAAKEVAADPAAAARSIVLRQLTMGPRTRAQVRAAMARKDIPEDVANAVLDRFEEVDLIDDQEFSRQWVQSRHLGRGLAPRALAHELRQRGIAEDTVKEAVEKVTPDDELTAARELVRRKAVGMRNDDPQRRLRRLAGMLARKGYGGGVAMQAIREELADLAELELSEAEGLDLD